MRDIRTLLQGFVDTHVHAGPTLLPREFNTWELVHEAQDMGKMRKKCQILYLGEEKRFM